MFPALTTIAFTSSNSHNSYCVYIFSPSLDHCVFMQTDKTTSRLNDSSPQLPLDIVSEYVLCNNTTKQTRLPMLYASHQLSGFHLLIIAQVHSTILSKLARHEDYDSRVARQLHSSSLSKRFQISMLTLMLSLRQPQATQHQLHCK